MSTHPNIPFHCGSQRMDWKEHNCEYCSKRYADGTGWKCDLERKIDEAYMDDGSVSDEVAKRMGVPDDVLAYNWRCTEFVEDLEERARVEAIVAEEKKKREAYANRNRPAPWIEDWLKRRKS